MKLGLCAMAGGIAGFLCVSFIRARAGSDRVPSVATQRQAAGTIRTGPAPLEWQVFRGRFPTLVVPLRDLIEPRPWEGNPATSVCVDDFSRRRGVSLSRLELPLIARFSVTDQRATLQALLSPEITDQVLMECLSERQTSRRDWLVPGARDGIYEVRLTVNLASGESRDHR